MYLDATGEEERHTNNLDVLGDALEERPHRLAPCGRYHPRSLRRVGGIPIVNLVLGIYCICFYCFRAKKHSPCGQHT